MYKQAPEAIGIYSDYKIIGRIEEKEMKRKSLLAILLAASMAASMTAATATVAFAETEEAAEETTDDAETADEC